VLKSLAELVLPSVCRATPGVSPAEFAAGERNSLEEVVVFEDWVAKGDNNIRIVFGRTE
jgi:hypothetical protein